MVATQRKDKPDASKDKLVNGMKARAGRL